MTITPHSYADFYMAIVTWLTLLGASLMRAKAWTRQGTIIALGNRDNLPEATALAGRAERTARNTAENFMLFAAISAGCSRGRTRRVQGGHGRRNLLLGPHRIHSGVLRGNRLSAYGGMAGQHRRIGSHGRGHSLAGPAPSQRPRYWNENTLFQSRAISTTVQPLAAAASRALSSLPTFDCRS